MKDTKELREEYKKRLKKIIGKKFDTTMIYPLSIFESVWGHLWGHGKNGPLTEEERMNKVKWEECRKNILNTGNQQKRNAYAELDGYSVIWEGYQTVLLPIDKFNEAKQKELIEE